MTTPTGHPAAQTHPWFLRLQVDVDPAGNPIGRSVVHFEGGREVATIHLSFPDPFDSISDAFADLLTTYVDFIGEQPTLF
jgi:hypothetical protein